MTECAWYSVFSMKNALKIPVVFSAFFLFWSLIIGFSVTLGSYESLLILITDHAQTFFLIVVRQMLVYVPLCLLLSFFMVVLYLMRHKTILFLSIPLMCALAVVSATICIPLSYRGLDLFDASFSSITGKAVELSKSVHTAGFIRPDGSNRKIVWFDERFAGTRVLPVVIVDYGIAEGTPVLSVYPWAEYDPENTSLVYRGETLSPASGGVDPLVDLYTESTWLRNFAYSSVNALLSGLYNSTNRSVLAYMALSGALFSAVGCLWLVSHTTGWKLLNLILCTAIFCVILGGYSLVQEYVDGVVITSFIPYSGIDPASVVYAAFAAIVIIIGIPVSIFRVLKGQKETV